MRGRRHYYREFTWDQPDDYRSARRRFRRLRIGISLVVLAGLVLALVLAAPGRFTLSISPLAIIHVDSRLAISATPAQAAQTAAAPGRSDGALPGAAAVAIPFATSAALAGPQMPAAGRAAAVFGFPLGRAHQPLTITYWEQEGDDGAALLDELAAGFMRANPGVTVRRVHFRSTEELREQFSSSVLAGDGPELARGPNDVIASLIGAGAIRPIDQLFDQAAFAAFFPGSLRAATAAHALWGLPDNDGSHLMLLYNKKLVQEVPPDTHSWIAQLKTLTDAPNGQYGLAYNQNEPYWLIPWIGGYGGWPLDGDDHPDLNNEAVIDALGFVRDLALVQRVLAPVSTYDTAAALFKAGKVAYLIDGPWNLADYTQAGVDMGIASLPRISETGWDPIPMTAGKYWLFNRNVSRPRLDAARRFVVYMTGASAQQKWLERLGHLPSSRQVAQSPFVTDDPLLAASVMQLSKGRGIPPAPAMYCALDSMRPGLEAVMAGSQAAPAAAQQMQADADRCAANSQ